MERSFSRPPALKKDIIDINEEDSRVQIIGTVIEYIPGVVGDSNSLSQLVITDGTANIKVLVDENLDRLFKIRERIRVFGTVIPNDEDRYDLNAEIIQDMNNLDINLYKEVRKLREK